MAPIDRTRGGLNVVAIVILLGSIALGLVASMLIRNPLSIVVMVIVVIVPGAMVNSFSPKLCRRIRT